MNHFNQLEFGEERVDAEVRNVKSIGAGETGRRKRVVRAADDGCSMLELGLAVMEPD
jgi:hypothetical protein